MAKRLYKPLQYKPTFQIVIMTYPYTFHDVFILSKWFFRKISAVLWCHQAIFFWAKVAQGTT